MLFLCSLSLSLACWWTIHNVVLRVLVLCTVLPCNTTTTTQPTTINIILAVFTPLPLAHAFHHPHLPFPLIWGHALVSSVRTQTCGRNFRSKRGSLTPPSPNPSKKEEQHGRTGKMQNLFYLRSRSHCHTKGALSRLLASIDHLLEKHEKNNHSLSLILSLLCAYNWGAL